MMQDPKKKEVGEMGKPSLKAKFEAAMQKQYKSRPENIKESFRSSVKEGVGEAIAGNIMSSAERLAGGAKKVMEKLSGSKKPKLLKSMSKK
tara:strand:- start:316 stop:588 length:273 start_codon:yes stop_codon:yes gene_type:complete